MLDAVVAYSDNNSYYTSERTKDYENYDIFNGVLDPRIYTHIISPYNLATPARPVNYELITPRIEVLVGELMTSDINFSVSLTNPESVSKKMDRFSEESAKKLLEGVLQEISQETGNDMTIPSELEELPDDPDDYMSFNFREDVEESIFHGIQSVIKRERLIEVYKRCLYDLCIAGKCFIRPYVRNGMPTMRRIDPRSCVYQMDSNVDDTSKTKWFGEERWMTVQEILDEYREDLSANEQNDLYALREFSDEKFGGLNKANRYYETSDIPVKCRVLTVEWLAEKDYQVVVSPNKYDESSPFYKEVKKDYKLKKGEELVNRRFIERWEATKIGHKIVCRYRKSPYQPRKVANLANTKLSYYGVFKNNFNGKTISIVDQLKNLQAFYNIAMYSIEATVARAKGKAVIYDVSQKPEKMSFEDVLYHAANSGLIPINSAQEGVQSRYNQFGQIDFSLSESFKQLLALKEVLEGMADRISGINEFRQGAGSGNEGLGTTRMNLAQSNLVTAPLVYQHQKLIEESLDTLANIIKVVFAKNEKMSYILGDRGVKVFETSEELSLHDFGIFITDGFREKRRKDILINLAEKGLSAGALTFEQVLDIYEAETATRAKHIFKDGVKVMQQMQQQSAQMQAEAAQMEAMQKDKELQVKMEMNKEKVSGDIAVAQINKEAAENTKKRHTESAEDIANFKEKSALDKLMLEGTMDQPVQ